MEELKLVIEALTGLGAQAKEAFIWWMVFDKLLPSLVGLFAIGSLSLVVHKAISVMSGQSDTDQFLKWARDELRTGVAGPLSDGERHRTISELRRLVEERRK